MDTAHRVGDRRVWHFECPACQHLQPLKFEQLKWDSNETTKPEGKWRSIVEEVLGAVDAMRVGGDIEPMFTFVTETLGHNHHLDCELMIDAAAVISGQLKAACDHAVARCEVGGPDIRKHPL